MIPPEIELDFAPTPTAGLSVTEIGGDLLVVGGPPVATVLSGPAAILWQFLSPGLTLRDIAADIAEAAGIEPAVAQATVLDFARQIGMLGLLDGVHPAPTASQAAENTDPWTPPEAGRPLVDKQLRLRDGSTLPVSELAGHPALLVHWDSDCGHCHELERALVERVQLLRDRGIRFEFVVDAESSSFRFTGTPTALLIGASGVLEQPMAAGTDQVIELVDQLTGQEPLEQRAPLLTPHLPAAPAMCVPGDRFPVQRSQWSATQIYELHDCFVGLRVDSVSAGRMLDRLFPGARVENGRVPASYSVQLDAPDAETPTPTSVLVHGGSELVHSPSPSRVLAALLRYLDVELGTADPVFAPVAAAGLVRNGRAVLVPWGVRHWSPRLEPLLAAHGYSFVDGPNPALDVATSELVIPTPLVFHDPSLLDDLDKGGGLGGSAQRRVRPGRYPLDGWLFPTPGEQRRLSVARAVANAVPCVPMHDPRDLVPSLTRLFGQLPAFEVPVLDEDDFVDRLVRLGELSL